MPKLRAIPVYLTLAVSGSSLFALYGTLSAVYRIREAGLDPLQLILVGTVLELTVFLFEIPTGIVADAYSRRLSCVIGWAVIGVGFVVESTHPSFVPILIGQVLWGIGFTFTSGAFQAWIVDEVQNDEGGSVGRLLLRGSQAGQLGALVAIGVAVWLGHRSLALPLFAAGVGFLALAVFGALTMPERGFRPLPRGERESWQTFARTLREGVGVVRSQPTLAWILLIAVLIGSSSEPLDRLWELHFLRSFQFPGGERLDAVTWFGIISAVSLVLGIGGAEWVRRRLDLDRAGVAVRALMGMNGVLVVAIAVFALAPNFTVALAAMWTLSVLRRVSDPVLATWTNQQIPSQVRATVLSMQTQGDSLGQVVGGPALGGLARASLPAAFLATSALLLPVQALYARLSRRQGDG